MYHREDRRELRDAVAVGDLRARGVGRRRWWDRAVVEAVRPVGIVTIDDAPPGAPVPPFAATDESS
ncbi:hypothetical protein GS931_19715 [Rhodococcus hoagii]|nr:hypothetical protein [Prescottella equi]